MANYVFYIHQLLILCLWNLSTCMWVSFFLVCYTCKCLVKYQLFFPFEDFLVIRRSLTYASNDFNVFLSVYGVRVSISLSRFFKYIIASWVVIPISSRIIWNCKYMWTNWSSLEKNLFEVLLISLFYGLISVQV